ncbi:carboxymuconolactone decarboxylase family protein [Burkholderia gladioli]|uniref:carboxymuconolactone decarboxylase family protein n=1 Tax=Burkholderia gladioli TaxID=28095 RepID=UPI00064940AB|nr:carboxymuconolactone decarboxylase family protein [Burkholderia gladioli]
MGRLQTIDPSAAVGDSAEVFNSIRASVGKVPNAYATIGTHNPKGLAAMLHLDAIVAQSSLRKADIETIKLAISALSGCDYCVAAHSLLGKGAGLTAQTLRDIRENMITGDARRDALLSFVRTVYSTRGTVPTDVVDAIRAAGFTDQQVIDMLFVVTSITFTNLVNRVNDTVVDFPVPA